MTRVNFEDLRVGETRRYQITVTSSTLDLTTVTSFVFQVRESYQSDPVINKSVTSFDSVATGTLVVSVTLTSAETALLSTRSYIAGGECRVGSARYSAVEGEITVQYNPVSS